MFDDSIKAFAKLAFDPLTTPDSEDWLIIPDNNRIHLTALREINGTAQIMLCKPIPLTAFKDMVRELKPDHDLGLITVVMCADSKARGGDALLSWLGKKAKTKNFSLTSFFGPAPTEQALAVHANQEEDMIKRGCRKIE